MPTTVEGTHQIGDTSLFTKSWNPDGPSVAKLIFLHGFAQHVNRHYELFVALASRGIEVHGFDQRGWGHNVHKPADKGDTGPTSLVISDIVSFIKTHVPSSLPVFVMGHSMGGAEALILASDPTYADLTKEIRGWLLESPFIAFSKGSKPNPITVFLGKLAGKVVPKVQKSAPVPPEQLTRDPETLKSLKDDELIFQTGTLEGLSGMLERAALLEGGKVHFNKGIQSLWLSHGTKDTVTSYEASLKWFNEQAKDLADKEFKTYEGWYHQLNADLATDRPVFAKDVGDWILARVNIKQESKL